MSNLSVFWLDRKREPVCPPNPDYPHGVDVGEARCGFGKKSCHTPLPYPARRCGVYIVRCQVCDASAAITTAGRADDPRSVTIACKAPSSTPRPQKREPHSHQEETTKMSNFDPDLFMQQTVDVPLETDYKLVPIGEYPAMIDDWDQASDVLEQFEFEYKKGPNAGQPGTMTKFTCPFVLTDDKVKLELGRDKLVVIKPFILQIENGAIATGVNKNVELGKLFAAVGRANPPWSLSSLRGAGPLMVKVIHKRGKRKDGSDFENAEVERVLRIA